MIRRTLVRFVAPCLIALLLPFVAAGAALAQAWPARTITVIVPFPAGGSADTLARRIGQHLSERTGQAVVIENRPGAGGNIGTDVVAKAAPDGYTLMLAPSSFPIAPHLYAQLSFDPIRDFAPVADVGSIPMVVIVHPSFPGTTLADLIALAKARPGDIAYASAGVGTTNHLATELFKVQTGTNLMHIPYRGNPLAVVDVIGGRVPVMFDFVLTGLQHVRDGKVRALATTGARRSSVMPEVPTAIEQGLADFEASTWFGVYAPAATPRPIVERLNAEINAVLALPIVRERLGALGVELTPGPPEQLRARTQAEFEKWGPIIRAAGIRTN
jgi:tripartite-type tricarboxylate transporter receptor subunit TctC